MDRIIQSLRERYSHIHPLIFKRSCEKAVTNGELFDILSSLPENYPIIWCDKDKMWKHIDNLLQPMGDSP
jgi:hypothetical protein